MKFFCLLCCLLSVFDRAYGAPPEGYQTDSLVHPKFQIGRSLLYTQGVNVFIWGINRFVERKNYAKIGWSSVVNNFGNGFKWDNDYFGTNFMAHPFHGSLYYNIARCNGLNYYQSTAVAFSGSFVWEMVLEKYPPSTNDVILTPVAGAALGEVTYRISERLFTDYASGRGSLFSEIAGVIISPVNAISRLVEGRLFRRNPSAAKSSLPLFPLKTSLSVGLKLFTSDSYSSSPTPVSTLELQVHYGNPFELKYPIRPYDYFTVGGVLNLYGARPVLSELGVKGLLWGEVSDSDENPWLWGIFQYFQYYEMYIHKPRSIDHTERMGIIPLQRYRNKPMMFAEGASFGPGFLYSNGSPTSSLQSSISAYTSAILLGGSQTAYYRLKDRDYNYGSGFGIRLEASVSYLNRFYAGLESRYYRLFTWKGYAPQTDLDTVDPVFFNVQGDRGNSEFFTLHVEAGWKFYKAWSLEVNYRLDRSEMQYVDYAPSSLLSQSVGVDVSYDF